MIFRYEWAEAAGGGGGEEAAAGSELGYGGNPIFNSPP
jgi:hypothetical protein